MQEFIPDQPEMPIILLSAGWNRERGEAQRQWRDFLEGNAGAVFATTTLEETAAILEECEKMGTPVGLLVVESREWTRENAEWVKAIRERYVRSPVRIFACCETWTHEHLIDCVDAGADASFAAPWDWDLLARKARRTLEHAAELFELQAGKKHVEHLLRQHRQAAVSQDLWRLDLERRRIDFSDRFKELSGL